MDKRHVVQLRNLVLYNIIGDPQLCQWDPQKAHGSPKDSWIQNPGEIPDSIKWYLLGFGIDLSYTQIGTSLIFIEIFLQAWLICSMV